MHFAEFGVVMMLFLIGLELRPALLWRMRGPILGLGGCQVVGTAVVLGVAALIAGLAWKPALGGRTDSGDVLDRDRAAIARREGPAQDAGRRGVLRRPALSGHRGHPDPRRDAVARRDHCRRSAGSPRRRADGGLPAWQQALLRARRWSRASWWPGGFCCGRVFRYIARDAVARDVHGDGALHRGGHRAAHAEARPFAGARHVPRRRGAGGERIPGSTRSRHRAVQGAAARALLHLRGCEHRFRAHGAAARRHRAHRGGADGC